MYLYYRGFLFDNNEIEYTRSKDAVRNGNGQVQYIREIWQCKGKRHAASQSALITALGLVENALAYNGGDVGIYLDDATTLTNDFIVSSQTLGGVRITKFAYPEGTGAEFSTFRTFTFEIEADHPITLGVPFNLTYNEQVTFEGNGGPRIIYLDVLEGPPQGQIVQQQTSFRAVQSGSATASFDYPVENPPIWPDALKGPESSVVKRYDLGRSEFGMTWNYVFESADPLIGGPFIYR